MSEAAFFKRNPYILPYLGTTRCPLRGQDFTWLVTPEMAEGNLHDKLKSVKDTPQQLPKDERLQIVCIHMMLCGTNLPRTRSCLTFSKALFIFTNNGIIHGDMKSVCFHPEAKYDR